MASVLTYSILLDPITLQSRFGTKADFATIPSSLILFSAAPVELANPFLSISVYPCATYSIIRKIDILLDSQYTGNKRVWRAEKFKQFINIVKFPQFFLPFSHVNTYQKKENLL